MTFVNVQPLPVKLYQYLEANKLTIESGCYSNSFRATLLSKSDKFSTKFSYVAGEVTDEKGIVHEHGFLHAVNGNEDFYFDPTLDRHKSRKLFKYRVLAVFTIAQLENLLADQVGTANFQKMVDGKAEWCQPRLRNGSLTFEYA